MRRKARGNDLQAKNTSTRCHTTDRTGVKGARKCSHNWLFCTFLKEALDFKIKAWDVQTKKYSREEISFRKYAPSDSVTL